MNVYKFIYSRNNRRTVGESQYADGDGKRFDRKTEKKNPFLTFL